MLAPIGGAPSLPVLRLWTYTSRAYPTIDVDTRDATPPRYQRLPNWTYEPLPHLPATWHRTPFSELLRFSLEELVAGALDLEADAFLLDHTALRTESGAARITRNGFLPTRHLLTSLGSIRVRAPRLRDHSPARDGRRVRFTSAIIESYKRRMSSCDDTLPFLMLEAMTTGCYVDALCAFTGDPKTHIHPYVADGLSKRWRRWRALLDTRDLSQKRYTQWWAEGLGNVTGTSNAPGLLALAGKTHDGTVELITVEAGNPNEPESWSSLIEELRARGIDQPTDVSPLSNPIREGVRRAF